MSTTYHFLAASAPFFEEHIVVEILEERTRHYARHGKPIDFWLVREPQFLEAPQLAELSRRCPRPAAAIVSTDGRFIIWLKHRLQYVVTGSFEAPSPAIPEPLASRTPVR